MAQQATTDPRLISYDTLRKAIGWLGISLPAVMITGNYFYGNCRFIQDTNSHYYYTITGNLFTGILCAVALFLIVYKGYNLVDNIVTSLAGCFAFGIAMYPTNDNSANSCAIIHLPLSTIRNNIHYGFAAAFFIILAFISLFLFTKYDKPKTKQKIIRNRIYRTCGVIILVAIGLMALYDFSGNKLHWMEKYKPIFWMEWVALAAFGISWLVKGKLVLDDDPNTKK